MHRRKFIGSAAAAGAAASLVAPAATAAPPSEAAGKPFLNLRDYGAAGDNKADDGPALQKALDALAAAGGGRLVIPPGRFLIKTPVVRDFLNKASDVRIMGSGSASQLVIRSGKDFPAVRIANLQSLVAEGIAFVGIAGERTDAQSVFVLGYCDLATFRDCTFYGLSGFDSRDGALLYASYCDLRLERCGFRGCAWGANPLVDNQGWLGCVVDGCWFLDYGTLNGVYVSKTPMGSTLAWLRVGVPAYPAQTGSNSQGLFTVRHTKFDEGAGIGILVDPGVARVPRVHIDGVEVNCAPSGKAAGISLRNVDRALIENSMIGYNKAAVSDAVCLSSVASARLERLFCLQNANRITADKACGKLILEDCQYKTLSSAAKKTLVDGEAKG